MKAHKIKCSFHFHKIKLIKVELVIKCNFIQDKYWTLGFKSSLNLASLFQKILFLFNFVTYSCSILVFIRP